MNKEESLALLEQGRDAWNAWAEDLLAERERLEAVGEWETAKEEWEDRAQVDFEGHEFEIGVDFDSFVSPTGPNSEMFYLRRMLGFGKRISKILQTSWMFSFGIVPDLKGRR